MTSNLEGSTLLDQVFHAIEHDDIVLPTLPGVAVKIQEMLDDPNVSADQIVSVLSSDPFISAQIIKSANSAAFAGRPPVDRVREAATRLGYRQLRNIVINITMSKMLYSNNHVINQHLKEVWKRSREVAVISYIIASRQPHLSPDQAMLAGLIHNIGVLPLCQYIEKDNIRVTDDELASIVLQCSILIGTKLLKKWNFPQDIIEAVAESVDIQRESSLGSLPDYADVVTFAKLQDRQKAKFFAWNSVAAVKRLGLNEIECALFLEHNAAHIEEVEGLLGINPSAKPVKHGSLNSITQSPEHQPEIQPKIKRKGFLSYLLGLWK